MSFADTPVLENAFVRLEPLAPAHAADLAAAVAVDELWRAWYTRIPSPEAMGAQIESRRARQREGRMAPWAVIDPREGRAVGMTSYFDVDPDNRRLEIGGTWLGRSVQRTPVNTAAKLLLLTRAFEQLGCIAVEFRTHWHNSQSRAAIARLGAKQDGVLRNHTIMPNGTLRDTVVFSIVRDEWPTVAAALRARLERPV